MARGKHAARAALRRQRREEEQRAEIAERLRLEQAALSESEQLVDECAQLTAEIETLRSELHFKHAEEEEVLRAEVEALLAVLGEAVEKNRDTKRRRMMPLRRQRRDVIGLGIEAVEDAIRETERRLMERYPGEYIPPPEDLTILTNIGGDPKRFPVEVARTLQRARGIRR